MPITKFHQALYRHCMKTFCLDKPFDDQYLRGHHRFRWAEKSFTPREHLGATDRCLPVYLMEVRKGKKVEEMEGHESPCFPLDFSKFTLKGVKPILSLPRRLGIKSPLSRFRFYSPPCCQSLAWFLACRMCFNKRLLTK